MFDITETQEISVGINGNGKEIKNIDKAITSAIDIIRNNISPEQEITYHKEIMVEKEKYRWFWEKTKLYKTIEIRITLTEELKDDKGTN